MSHKDEPPVFVITVSGSDASGAAGMQADNRAILATGARPLNVVSALTLQTRHGVQSIALSSPELVRMHLLGLLNAYPVRVMKAGMLGNEALVQVLVEVIQQYSGIRLVLDPVLHATSGRPLLNSAGRELLIKELLPQTYLLTPNLPELRALSQADCIESEDQEASAVERLLDRGCQAVLVKGGHRPGDLAVDRLYSAGKPVQRFSMPKIDTSNTRGTGCMLASFCAARLARGDTLVDAVSKAKAMLQDALLNQQEQLSATGGIYF